MGDHSKAEDKVMFVSPENTYTDAVIINQWLFQMRKAHFSVDYFRGGTFLKHPRYRAILDRQPMLESMLCSFARLDFIDRELIAFATVLIQEIRERVRVHERGCRIVIPALDAFYLQLGAGMHTLSVNRKILCPPVTLLGVAELLRALRGYIYSVHRTMCAIRLFEQLFSFYVAELDPDVANSPCRVKVVFDGVHTHKLGSPIQYSLHLDGHTT